MTELDLIKKERDDLVQLVLELAQALDAEKASNQKLRRQLSAEKPLSVLDQGTDRDRAASGVSSSPDAASGF